MQLSTSSTLAICQKEAPMDFCMVGIRANMDVPALSYGAENERGWAGLCVPAVISWRPEENIQSNLPLFLTSSLWQTV